MKLASKTEPELAKMGGYQGGYQEEGDRPVLNLFNAIICLFCSFARNFPSIQHMKI
jgi:hypothetical protein